jgi:archaemetzincin
VHLVQTAWRSFCNLINWKARRAKRNSGMQQDNVRAGSAARRQIVLTMVTESRSGTRSGTPPRMRARGRLSSPAEESLLDALAPILDQAFGEQIGVTEPITVPEDAYNVSRDQYHSTVLLDRLARHKRPEWDRLLGIADVDLYTPNLNFVFGQADAKRGVAVFSLARLHTSDRDRFVHRAATEAIHEIGHTYGLAHCDNTRCVMWFSNTLEETDRKGTRFCARHAQALRAHMRSGHHER